MGQRGPVIAMVREQRWGSAWENDERVGGKAPPHTHTMGLGLRLAVRMGSVCFW